MALALAHRLDLLPSTRKANSIYFIIPQDGLFYLTAQLSPTITAVTSARRDLPIPAAN